MRYLLLFVISIGAFAAPDQKEKLYTESEVEQLIDKKLNQRLKQKENLSAEDQKILEQGTLPTGQYVVGGLLSIYPGFGIGHAVQGRYSDMGWKFTVGEVTSIVVLAAGISDCVDELFDKDRNCNNSMVLIGALGYLGFRVWEIVDAWYAPYANQQRYYQLKNQSTNTVRFIPVTGKDKLGLSLTYTF